jgi:hypothetical protein
MIENQSETSKKKIMLGYSKKYSLYNSGCLVHCVARLLQKPVLEVHDRLKQFNCFFADGTGDVCLLDLTKVPIAYPNLEYLGKQVFDQEKALEYIKQAGGLIVEVDGNSIMAGTQQHFVFFVGGGVLEDPLGGVVRKTSYYKNIISIRPFKIKEDNANLIKKIVDLETSLKNMGERVTQLEADAKANNDLIFGYQESLTSAKSTESKLQADLKTMSDEKNTWKNRYEAVLLKTVDKYSALELFKLAWQQLFIKNKK